MDLKKESKKKYMELGSVEFLDYAANKGFYLVNVADNQLIKPDDVLKLVEEFLSE
jgi:hypothetical protein